MTLDAKQKTTRARALGFAVVGVLGFVVDAVVLSLTRGVLGPYAGRLASFACAVTTTYALNRRFVFDASGSAQSWVGGWWRFVLANMVGGGVNLSVYALLVASNTPLFSQPLVALGIGSVAGLIFNFVLSDRFVFRRNG